MAIQVPKERAYYQSSPVEPDYILCWIPREELEVMVMAGQARPDVLANYPYGLEIEVSKEALEESGITLNTSPENIRKAYALLRRYGILDESGYVQGKALENFAKYIKTQSEFRADTLPKPAMSDGEEPSVIFHKLAAKKGN